jgi:hypothetical protein
VEAVARLGAARYAEDDGIDRRAVHVVVSPPDSFSITSTGKFYDSRSEALDIAKEAGVRGGMIVPHGYRVPEEVQGEIQRERDAGTFSGGDWHWIREHDRPWTEFVEWSPHWHVIGLTRDLDAGDRSDGWVVHNVKRKRADGERRHSLAPFRLTDETGYEDMASVVGYVLSHATYEIEANRQVITWFGSLHGSQFNPDPTDEDRQLESPLSPGSWRAIRRYSRKVVGSHGDQDDDGDDGDDEKKCPHPDCSGTWHPIHEAPDYLDQCGGRLDQEAYDRIHRAYLWSEGDIHPPPGMKNPTTESQAREAFQKLL